MNYIKKKTKQKVKFNQILPKAQFLSSGWEILKIAMKLKK